MKAQPDSQEALIGAIKQCHQTLWAGGKLSPLTAFGKLCEIIFVKICDEQAKRKKGEPCEFQIKTHELNCVGDCNDMVEFENLVAAKTCELTCAKLPCAHAFC